MDRYGASSRDYDSNGYSSNSSYTPRQGGRREPDEYDRIFGNRGPRGERGNSRRERTGRGSDTDSESRAYNHPAYRGPASRRAAHPPSSDDESDYAPSRRAGGGARASGTRRRTPADDAELGNALREAREYHEALDERYAGGRAAESSDDESDLSPRTTTRGPGAGREQRRRPALNDDSDSETGFGRLEREIEGRRRTGGSGSRGGMPGRGSFRGGASMDSFEDMEDFGRSGRRGAVSGGRPPGR